MENLRVGAMYSEAVDPVEFDRVYTETDVLIEIMEDDTEKKENMYGIILKIAGNSIILWGANGVMDAEAPNK